MIFAVPAQRILCHGPFPDSIVEFQEKRNLFVGIEYGKIGLSQTIFAYVIENKLWYASR